MYRNLKFLVCSVIIWAINTGGLHVIDLINGGVVKCFVGING